MAISSNNSWHARLEKALIARQKTQADLVRITGKKASSVSDWISGETKMMDGQNAAKVCAFLQINPAWLFENRLPSGLEDDSTQQEEIGVPVVGTAQLGNDGYWLETEYPVGQGEGFVRYPMRDKNTYALRVKGDSMRPRIKPGEFVVIEPNRAFVSGDEVMVKTKDGRSMVKVFSHRRDGHVELLSINEDHRPITLEESQVEKIHYVGGILKSGMYYERT